MSSDKRYFRPVNIGLPKFFRFWKNRDFRNSKDNLQAEVLGNLHVFKLPSSQEHHGQTDETKVSAKGLTNPSFIVQSVFDECRIDKVLDAGAEIVDSVTASEYNVFESVHVDQVVAKLEQATKVDERGDNGFTAPNIIISSMEEAEQSGDKIIETTTVNEARTDDAKSSTLNEMENKSVADGKEGVLEMIMVAEQNEENIVAVGGNENSMVGVGNQIGGEQAIIGQSTDVGAVEASGPGTFADKDDIDDVQKTIPEKKSETDMEKVVLCDMEPKFFFNNVKFYPALAIANLVGIIIQYVFNALSGSGPDGTIFLNTTGDLSDKYYTAITPAGWTFSIWGFIYFWQSAWVIFALVNICRKARQGDAAYKDPPYIPNSVFLVQLLVSALNITWLITFDREEIEVACATLIAYTLLQYFLLTISVRQLEQASPKLVQQERTTDIWLHRGLLQNGIGIQLAWVNIATLLNLQMVLIYSGDEVLSADDAGTLALAILAVHVVVLPLIDMILLDRYTRYLITPYIVVIVALAGSISKNWDSAKDNSIFSAVLIAYACCLLCTKIGVTIYRHFKRPRFTTICPFTGQLA